MLSSKCTNTDPVNVLPVEKKCSSKAAIMFCKLMYSSNITYSDKQRTVKGTYSYEHTTKSKVSYGV